jgi:hypothetical protein
VHDPGKILLDVALAVALGGDCLADVGTLRAESAVFGPVASDPTVSRLIDTLAASGEKALRAIRAARAEVRQHVWRLADREAPDAGGTVTVDLDGVLVIAHSDKEDAAPTCVLAQDIGMGCLKTGAVPRRHSGLRPAQPQPTTQKNGPPTPSADRHETSRLGVVVKVKVPGPRQE